MALTFIQLKRHALRAIGGYPSLAPGQTNDERLAEIVNDAGKCLMAEAWNWRTRTPVLLNTVADQEYVALSPDVEEIVGLWNTDESGPAALVTMDTIETLRRGPEQVTTSDITHACLSTAATEAGDGAPTVRLEVWPTPTAAVTGALSLRYRQGWVEIDSDEDDGYLIPVPNWIEPLLREYVWAHAEAYEKGDLSQALARVQAGVVYEQCCTKDSRLQQDLGQLPDARQSGGRWYGGWQ